MKLHCEEQKDRAETAEYQIASISQEYRKLISTRDAEIRRLKTETETLRDKTKTEDDASPLKELALGSGQPVPGGEREGGGRDVIVDGAYDSVDLDGELEWAGLQYGNIYMGSLDPHTEVVQMRQEMASLREELKNCKERLKVH